MIRKIRLYPYQLFSKGCRNLTRALGALRIRPNGHYRPFNTHLIVNWGTSQLPNWFGRTFKLLNKPDAVGRGTNKRTAFDIFRNNGVQTPEFTSDSQVARGWLGSGKVVVGRRILTGKGGAGIIIMQTPDQFQPCPLYTLYKKKKHEYRVHVFQGQIIDFQEKKKRRGFIDNNPQIRVEANGWVFCRDGVALPEDVKTQAIKATNSLGLDFGGVDVVYNERENKAYVLEVNSAPGIEGTTVNSYANAIRNYVRRNNNGGY